MIDSQTMTCASDLVDSTITSMIPELVEETIRELVEEHLEEATTYDAFMDLVDQIIQEDGEELVCIQIPSYGTHIRNSTPQSNPSHPSTHYAQIIPVSSAHSYIQSMQTNTNYRSAPSAKYKHTTRTTFLSAHNYRQINPNPKPY